MNRIKKMFVMMLAFAMVVTMLPVSANTCLASEKKLVKVSEVDYTSYPIHGELQHTPMGNFTYYGEEGATFGECKITEGMTIPFDENIIWTDLATGERIYADTPARNTILYFGDPSGGNTSGNASGDASGNAIDVDSIEVKGTYTLGSNLNVSIQGQNSVYYKIVPNKSANYMIASFDETYDPKVYFYNSKGKLLVQNDDSNEADGLNFSISWPLEAGETYYIRFSSLHDEDNYTVRSTEGAFPVYSVEFWTNTGNNSKQYRTNYCMQGRNLKNTVVDSSNYWYEDRYEECERNLNLNYAPKGYVFDGWYTAATGGTLVTKAMVINANAKYYAHWVPGVADASGNATKYTYKYSVRLNAQTKDMLVGDTYSIVAKSNKTCDQTKTVVEYQGSYSYASSNTAVAKVSNNTVTAVAAGKAVITVTDLSSGAKSSVTINVSNKPVQNTQQTTQQTTPQKGQDITTTTAKKDSTAATYEVNSSSKKTVTYEAPKTTSDKAVIPDTVKDANGNVYKVTAVAEGAFKNNKKITTVTVGKNVTTIGKNAFKGTTKLSTVKITGKVTSIGKDAFSGAKKLKSVTLNGNSLKSVGKNAFKGVKKNCKITIQAKSKKQYNKIVKMIKKSGAKKVKFSYKKKK